MRTRIKFCGMTQSEDVQYAAQLGVDAVGLVFVPESPRALTLAAGAELSQQRPLWMDTVALFVDPPADWVRSVIDAVSPTWLQFHGSEEAGFCESFNLPYIKAIGPSSDSEKEAAFFAYEHSAAAFLVDSQIGTGGTGQAFDWSQWADKSASIPQPWLLAGGLTPDNIATALTHLEPWGVDVSSGIERARGVKDRELMRQFVSAVRESDDKKGGKDD